MTTKLPILIFTLGLAMGLRPAAAEEVALNFNDTDLLSVIDSVSQITGKNFVIDPRVKGRINMVSSRLLNEDEVYDVFLSILQVHGFAAIQSGSVIKIIPEATARHSAAFPANGNVQTLDSEI